ncbi:MAG TPA: chloride channel protein [Verrucomicrobiae bacterium]|nr:chloride channel protein [Verrucomicrobiae bacterium]
MHSWLPRVRSIGNKLRRLIWPQLAKRSPGENAFLLLLPLVGLAVGFTSVVTAHIISFLQNQFWGSGQNLLSTAADNPWPFHIIIPLVGGLLVGVIGWFFRVQTRGGGITTIMQAVSLKGGVISLRQTVPRDWAAIVTISTGGSLGREGAMALLASAIGSYTGRRFKLSSQQLRVLVCASAAAALAAVYNAPIGGSLFALEILMGNFALEVLGPVVVVSVISTLVFRSCMGNLPRFVVPHYELVSAWELLPYLILGLLSGMISLLFMRTLFGSQDAFEKLPLPTWLKPALGMTLVGVIGVWFPHVYGNGFETVNLTLQGAKELTLALLLILIPMKILASSLTFGSGGAGGLFTPSLMLGSLLGGAFGFEVHRLFPHATAEQGAYALVGMGGVLAGITHAPLTAIMMIFEQTNNYQIVLPLMFVCIVSHFTTRLFKGRSLDEESLRRRGVVLPTGLEAGVMQSLRVEDIMHDDVPAVSQSVPFSMVVEQFLKEPYSNLYVVNNEGKFLGAIRLHSLKEMLHQGESLSSVIADDLVDDSFQFVTPRQNLADVMDIFWRENAERLPVIDSPADRKLIGWISKRDLLGVYSQEIMHKRQLLGHFIVREDGEKRDVFVELPEGFELRTFELPAHLNGRTLAELAPRASYGIHILAIKRRDPTTGRSLTEMPEPATRLATGDDLVVIGKAESLAQFMAALVPAVENAAE